jgi:hypothetical protein
VDFLARCFIGGRLDRHLDTPGGDGECEIIEACAGEDASCDGACTGSR